ncbi:MAG: hypothetical protein P4L98_05645 [Ancalomicrobiaceae bacterium]|nr:hypothetical protein [Ancalomicrobiaceae bacterium]
MSITMTELAGLARYARKKCSGEVLAHKFADIMERAADATAACVEAETLLTRFRPSADLRNIASVAFESVGYRAGASLQSFPISAGPVPAAVHQDDEAARHEARLAEIRANAPARIYPVNPF